MAQHTLFLSLIFSFASLFYFLCIHLSSLFYYSQPMAEYEDDFWVSSPEHFLKSPESFRFLK